MSNYSARRVTMVDTQVRPSDVTKYPIIEAMLHIPREAFVPEARREAAYLGENLDLGRCRALMEPRSLAKLLEALDIAPTDRVLDIGTASGYSAAVIGRMAASVVAVEEDEALADLAAAGLAAVGAGNVTLHRGAAQAGAPGKGPFDVILFQGAIETLPAAIESQLAEGGRIAAIFAEGALGTARIGRKEGGRLTWRDLFNAMSPVLPGFVREKGFTF